MNSIYVVRSGRIATVATEAEERETTQPRVPLPAGNGSMREGVTLGLAVATTTWAWIAAVDVFAGEPFHTFTMLGGIALFTAMHYLLNVIYGLVIVSGMRSAAREPGVVMAVVFGLLMLEFAFALVTVLLSNLGFGSLAWVRIFAGSVVGTAVAILVLSRTHPLAARLRQANDDHVDP